MVSFEEETYSTIFTSLKHPVRRKILRMLAEMPRNFSEMLEALEISSSHLTYHLENLGELVSKMEDGKYRLSTFGEAAVTTMSKVEEAPKVNRAKDSLSLPLRWKSLYMVLMVGLVVLAAISYTQYQSYNRLYSQYKELMELVELAETKEASLQFEHMLTLKLNKTEPTTHTESPYCFIYNQHENTTLHLVLTSRLSKSHITVSVQDEAGAVVWSACATASNIYSVPLISKGWYTISLVGAIIKMNNVIIVTMRVIEDVDCWLSLRIIYEGKYSPFIVIPAYFFR